LLLFYKVAVGHFNHFSPFIYVFSLPPHFVSTDWKNCISISFGTVYHKLYFKQFALLDMFCSFLFCMNISVTGKILPTSQLLSLSHIFSFQSTAHMWKEPYLSKTTKRRLKKIAQHSLSVMRSVKKRYCEQFIHSSFQMITNINMSYLQHFRWVKWKWNTATKNKETIPNAQI
jgi:hypothetical protein